MADKKHISQRKDDGHSEEEPEEEKTSFKLDLYFWTQTLVVALTALILLSTLVGRPICVVGSSMVPTLHEGDLLLLQSVAYTPRQGDIVVLRKPTFMSEPIIKRVIAVGGQHVTIDYDTGTVSVDGTPLNEPYINEPMLQPGSAEMSVNDIDVPEGSIYVLGDNRNASSDSRHARLSTVDERYVLGQAKIVLFPPSDFGLIH